uniref:Uncharacterized protein n=1 Tax=Rhizophora mucronata TaxID=61149 RepID=A0A2P2MPE7_RHIMU
MRTVQQFLLLLLGIEFGSR